jgi:phosphohistidine phosphatase SixA
MEMAMTSVSRWIRTPFLLAALTVWLGSPAASADALSGQELAQALRHGGYVLVVRNGRAHDAPPKTERERSPANLKGERELDSYGQGQLGVIGYAFRQLHIPVGDTLTSPAYRSRQSGTYFGFGERKTVEALAESAEPSWLAERVAEAPPAGKNTVLITHGSLIVKALGKDAGDIGPGDTLIYRPRDGGADVVARLTVADWAKMAVD